MVVGIPVWALTGEDSSNEDEDALSKDSQEDDLTWASEEILKDAVAAGYSVDDVLTAEAHLQAMASASSPKVRSADCVSGKHRGLLASRLVDDLTERKLAVRPWRGPLPKLRNSPGTTLGDALAKARFILLVKKLQEWQVGAAPASSSPPTLKQCRPVCEPRQGMRDLGGVYRVVGSFCGSDVAKPSRSILLHNRGQSVRFTFSVGLCTLFTRAGKPNTRAFKAHSKHAASGESLCFLVVDRLPQMLHFLSKGKEGEMTTEMRWRMAAVCQCRRLQVE